MSFLVIIASLIAFMILIINDKMIFSQKPVGRYYIGSVSVIGMYLKKLSVYRNIGKIARASLILKYASCCLKSDQVTSI